jgi:hypothetical protein
MSKSDTSVVMLKHLDKLAETPDGRQHHLIWARKLFKDKDIYIVSLELLERANSYTMWYATINEEGWKWISCALYGSVETLAIRTAEEMMNEQ